jgi:hypothetical protein
MTPAPVTVSRVHPVISTGPLLRHVAAAFGRAFAIWLVWTAFFLLALYGGGILHLALGR